jgi:hypothetical protein
VTPPIEKGEVPAAAFRSSKEAVLSALMCRTPSPPTTHKRPSAAQDGNPSLSAATGAGAGAGDSDSDALDADIRRELSASADMDYAVDDDDDDDVLFRYPEPAEPISRVYITGVLSEGTQYAFELPPAAANQYIGKKVRSTPLIYF